MKTLSKLTVKFYDMHGPRIDTCNMGKCGPIPTRTVVIHLTDEQQQYLRPMLVGKNYGTDVYEEYEVVCLE